MQKRSPINMEIRKAALCLIILQITSGDCSSVSFLTDDDFDAKTADGVWFVNIFAPWCPLCKSLSPVWEQLAVELKGKVHVAKVDGPENPITAKRFGIHAYPSLFLLRDGRTYEYTLDHGMGLKQFAQFALNGYKETPPRSWHQSPNSSFGRIMGRIFRVPRQTSKLYFEIHQQSGLPHPVLLGGVVTLLAIYGGIVLCIMDAYYTRWAAAKAVRPHQE
eukprot:jgi/Botrbrau1/1952/Bobra.0005s0044.1